MSRPQEGTESTIQIAVRSGSTSVSDKVPSAIAASKRAKSKASGGSEVRSGVPEGCSLRGCVVHAAAAKMAAIE